MKTKDVKDSNGQHLSIPNNLISPETPAESQSPYQSMSDSLNAHIKKIKRKAHVPKTNTLAKISKLESKAMDNGSILVSSLTHQQVLVQPQQNTLQQLSQVQQLMSIQQVNSSFVKPFNPVSYTHLTLPTNREV